MEAKSEKFFDEDHLFVQNPCNYFQEFMRAVLNCLGFNSEPPNSSSNVDDDGISSGQIPAGLPSAAADPPADAPVAVELRVAPPRAPPRPPVSGGRDPQTN
ncbi:hypothetical protein C2S51_019273 [Perilla frutescens var. frutescens]|nr:hypothetical protein C2S51_019273 [Perilla frutescens var. frutescens]